MKKLGLLLAAAAMVAFAGSAMAGSLPSSKAAIALGDLFALGPKACATDGPNPEDCKNGGTVSDTDFVPVMTTFIKTPNGKDPVFDVAVQCALITYTSAKVKGGTGSSKAASEGRISIRVKVTPVDKDGFATGAARYALPDNDGANPLANNDPPANGPAGVTYCSRFQELEVTLANFACIDEFGVVNITDCELEVSLLLETLNANAFNFVLPNVASGIQKVEVEARAQANADVFGSLDSRARGEAFIGMGSMLVETLRLVKAVEEGNTGPNFAIIDLE